MANVIKLKTGTSTPTTSDIVNGEVAIDTSAKKLYVNDSGTVKEIGGGSGGGGVVSDSDNNTVGGTNAGDSITNGTQNTFFGFDAGTATTSGNRNSAFGAYALAEHSTSFDNSCFGDGAGRYITTGSMNTCLGRRAGESITTSQSNTIVGLMADAEGSYNVCVGQQAGQYSSGSNSIIIGGFTGQDFTGSSNNFIGYQSAKDATSATENVCIGRGSGLDLSSGSKNVIIGHDSANSGSNDLTSGDNNIIIGHDAAASSATVDNEITLGDGNITKFRVPALNFIVKSSTATQGHVLTVDANGEAGFAAASGGGKLTLISNTTFTSAAAAVTFTSISGYTQYKIMFSLNTSGAGTLRMRVGIDGTYDTGNNYNKGGSSDTSMQILGGFSALSKHGEILISHLNQTKSTQVHSIGVGESNDASDSNFQTQSNGHRTTTAQNSIQIFGSSGDLSSGTISLYGIATS